MIYKTLTYGRTKNLGNYQSERLDVSAELEETDDPVEVLEELKKFVLTSLYPPEPEQQINDDAPF